MEVGEEEEDTAQETNSLIMVVIYYLKNKHKNTRIELTLFREKTTISTIFGYYSCTK